MVLYNVKGLGVLGHVADRERIGCCGVVCEVFLGWDGLSDPYALKKATRVG